MSRRGWIAALLFVSSSGCTLVQDFGSYEFGMDASVTPDARPDVTRDAVADGPIDPMNDPDNCGMIGTVCVAPPNQERLCEMGVCLVGECLAGFGDCDAMADGCEADLRTSATACGDCGMECPGSTRCDDAACYGRWERTWGGMGDDDGRGVAVDGAGLIYTAGRFAGDLDIGAPPPLSSVGGSDDALMLVLGPDGTDVRQARVGAGSGNHQGAAVAVTPEGVAIFAGRFTNEVDLGSDRGPLRGQALDAFAARINPDGTVRWQVALGGSGDDAAEAVAVSEDSVVVVGRTASTSFTVGGMTAPGLPPAMNHGFIAKLRLADGSAEWIKVIEAQGATDIALALGTAFTADGGIVVVGSVSGSAFFDEGLRVFPDRAGFIIAYEPNGDQRFLRAMGTPSTTRNGAEARGVFTDGSRIYVVGHTSNGASFEGTSGDNLTASADLDGDAFVARYAAMGAIDWVTTFGGVGFDVATGVAAVGGTVWATGFTTASEVTFAGAPSPSAGGNDALLVQLNAAGVLMNGRLLGSAGTDHLVSMAASPSGAAYAIGHFTGTIDLPNSGMVTTAGNRDVVLMRLIP